MPTDKPRIQVSLDPGDHEIVSMLAKQRNLSQSAVVRSLVEDALELQEDLYFANIAQEREKKGKSPIAFDDIWDALQD